MTQDKNGDIFFVYFTMFLPMTYNNGSNMLVGNSNFELHLLKLKTNWNHVNLHISKLINIPTIATHWDYTLYYTLVQTLNFPLL
jgi:hypothetical protein